MFSTRGMPILSFARRACASAGERSKPRTTSRRLTRPIQPFVTSTCFTGEPADGMGAAS
jgi:hypothetical protein